MNNSYIVRPMNALERIFYMAPGYKVMMTARLKGDVDNDKIKNAVYKIQKKHPLLRSKVVFDEKRNAFFSTENVEQVKIKFIEMKNDMHWYDAYVEELTIADAPENRPQISFIVLKGKKLSDLIVVASHTITDGMSLAIIIKDLLDAYDNPEISPDEVFPLGVLDFLPPKLTNSLKNIVTNLVAKYINYKWNKNPIYFTYNDYKSINDWFWKKYQYHAIFLELGKNESEQLLKECHKEKVSIGNAVVTAFIAAYTEIIGPFEGFSKNVDIPFDFRRHSENPVGDLVGMCSGAVEIPLDYNPGVSIMENAREFQKKVIKETSKLDTGFMDLVNLDPNLLDAMVTFSKPSMEYPYEVGTTENIKKLIADKKNISYKMISKFIKKVAGTVSSNLGRLNMKQEYGSLYLERVILLPLLKANTSIYLNGSTIGNKMVFSLSFGTIEGEDPKPKMNKMTAIRSRAMDLLGIEGKSSNSRYC